jgi:hypothetical protein
MNLPQLLPFFMVLTSPQDRQSRMAEAMFPAMIPVAPAHQAAVAAISASIQVDTEFRRVEQARVAEANVTVALEKEYIVLIEIVKKQGKDAGIPRGEFDALNIPLIKARLAAQPNLLDSILAPIVKA